MQTAKRYGRWGWWAIIGLVAILILIGLIIAAIASRSMKDTEDNTASVIETTVQDETKEDKDTAEKEEGAEAEAEENKDAKSEDAKSEDTKSDSKKETSSSSSSKSKKKEEPAVVTRCKAQAYMEKTLKGSTKLDCKSDAGIEEFRKLEGTSASSVASTPNSSAGVEVYESESLPKSGPEDILPVAFILAMSGFVATSMVMHYAKRER